MMMARDESPRPTVLIVSADAMAAALLGTLIELDGYQPLFPADGEPPAEALARLRPRLVLVDCDAGAACTADFFGDAAAHATAVVLFSHARLQGEVEDVAARHGLRAFALPIDRAALARLLADALLLVLLWVRSA